MICKMCATGADIVSRAKEINDEYFADELKTYGKMLHGLCKGATVCDCQHKESLNV